MIFSFFQVTMIETRAVGLPFSTFFSQWWITIPLVFLAAVFVAILVVLIVRRFMRLSLKSDWSLETVVLQVKVPKELRREDVEQGKNLQQLQELIGVAETFYQNIGSQRGERGFKAWLSGREDQIALELVNNGGKIRFFVACPKKLRSFVESQLHGQYPFADITEVSDYNIFSPDGVTIGSYLKFRRPSYFPIKTYKKTEADPMNTVTNALAKVADTDGAAIQIVVRSAYASWRSEGMRIAREMQQGKKFKDVTGSGSSKFLKEMFSAVKGSKPDAPGLSDQKETYRLSPLEEEMVKGLEEKASKAGLESNIRIITSAQTFETAKRYLDDILNAFGQYHIFEFGNSFKVVTPRSQDRMAAYFVHRQFDDRQSLVLNSEELASLFHLPHAAMETPKIEWLGARKALPPANLPSEGLLLGVSEYRNHQYEIRIKPQDRRRHMYVIGKSGGGKSVFMKSLVKQDVEDGRGVCIVDPHGDFAEECLEFVPKERAEDVIFFDPSDYDRPMALNMLEFDPKYPQQKTFAVEEMLKIFDQLYDLKATGGPMFELYMRNAMLLIMEDPESGSTILEVSKVLADEQYRKYKLSKCQTNTVRDFWTKEAEKAGGEASLANMVPYITSKLTPFVANDFLRPIIGQQKSSFNFREVMDEGKILFCALNKGKIGDLSAYLLGMVVVGKLLMSALARTEMDPEKRRDFYLYIDEFQNFLTDSISSILSEARKYGLDLIIAHQFISQLTRRGGDTQIRDAIFGNVGSMFAYRIGSEDAEFLEKEFSPTFTKYDLMNPEAFSLNAKILIDNTASKPFNMKAVYHPPGDEGIKKRAMMIKELSRYKYGRKRGLVEAELEERHSALDRVIQGAGLSGKEGEAFDF